MPQFRMGDIVEVEVPDPNGKNVKVRPVVILTPSDEIDGSDKILVAAVSSSHIPDVLPESYFELPFQNGRPHSRTGLTRRCVVKCDWRIKIPPSAIRRRRGAAPEQVLYRIAKYFADHPAG